LVVKLGELSGDRSPLRVSGALVVLFEEFQVLGCSLHRWNCCLAMARIPSGNVEFELGSEHASGGRAAQYFDGVANHWGRYYKRKSLLTFGTMLDLVESKFACDPRCIRVLEFSNFYVSPCLRACFCGWICCVFYSGLARSMRFVLIGNSWQPFFPARHE
jgi:hypothetical protein